MSDDRNRPDPWASRTTEVLEAYVVAVRRSSALNEPLAPFLYAVLAASPNAALSLVSVKLAHGAAAHLTGDVLPPETVDALDLVVGRPTLMMQD